MSYAKPSAHVVSTPRGQTLDGTAGEVTDGNSVPTLADNGTQDSTIPGPEDMPDGPYAQAAFLYWEAGWQPLPLPLDKKFPPPTGYTGKTAYSKKLTEEQIAQWEFSNRYGNIGLRIPSKVIALDVDAYLKGSTVKDGENTLRQLIEKYGPLPKTVMSTARPDGVGHLLYRIPDGGLPVILPGVLGPGIEAIQHHHRYSVVWPSRNPDADDAVYRWYLPAADYAGEDFWEDRYLAEEGFIPRVEDLPVLPEAWCHITPIGGKPGMVRGESAAPLGTYQIEKLLDSWNRDDLDRKLATTILDSYQSSVTSGKARHDSCLSSLTWAFKAGAAGLIDPRPVVETLDAMFSSDTHDRHVPGEFASMAGWAAANGPADAPAYRRKWDEARERHFNTPPALPPHMTASNVPWDDANDASDYDLIHERETVRNEEGDLVKVATSRAREAAARLAGETATGETAEKPQIVFRRASEIRVRKTNWLWDTTPEGGVPTSQGRIPKDMITMAAGLPGTGKSQYAIWLTAQLTNGTLPGCYHGTPKTVMYYATEDDWERTIAPRLIAAGADLKRVLHCLVRTETMQYVQLNVPEHHGALGEAAQENDVALVVFDPMLSHLGGKINANSEAEVRAALEPLVKAAAKYEFTVLGLSHFNKNTGDSDPLNRLMGSRGFSALLRALIVFAKDKDAEDEETTEVRYVISQAKNNLGRTDMPSYSYTIAGAVVPTDEGDAYVSRFVLGPETDTSVEQQMASAGKSPEDQAMAKDCKGWLRGYLTDHGGQSYKTEVEGASKKEGYSQSTLYRAKAALNIKSKSVGFAEAKAAVWYLPGA